MRPLPRSFGPSLAGRPTSDLTTRLRPAVAALFTAVVLDYLVAATPVSGAVSAPAPTSVATKV